MAVITKGMILGLQNVDTNRDGKIDGFQLQIRNQYLITVPLRSITTFEIIIDGKKISPEVMSFILRNQRINISNIRTISDIWWGIGEIATVHISKEGGLKSGMHDIECSIKIKQQLHPKAFEFPISIKTKLKL